jgi:predicted small metal-binding protein
MEKHLQCVVEGCETHFTASNEEEILKQVATHAATDHGVTEVSPELLAKVRSAIRDA